MTVPPTTHQSPSILRGTDGTDVPSVAAVTAADGAPVEQYDHAVEAIVRWAQNRDGFLCCVACGSFGPYMMVGNLSFCRACIREGSSRLFTAAEHAASEREAAR